MKLWRSLCALWDRIEAWFDPARDVALKGDGRDDEMKKPGDLP